MHFGFALEFSDIDLWNIDLLDKHLDLLDTDIPGKNFARCLQDVFNTSSRRLGRRKTVALKTCWRRLQDVFKTNKCLLAHELKIKKGKKLEKMKLEHHWHLTGFDISMFGFYHWNQKI